MTSPTLPAPNVSRRPGISLIWVVPVLAVIVAAWLLSREWRNHGRMIEIEFAEGAGVEAGRTRLQHKGVPVGIVDHVALKSDFSGVRVRVQLDRSANGLARAGAQFWIVHPEINFSGISGLEALVGGVHLRMRPGHGPPTTTFSGLDRPPAPAATERGPAFLLRCDRLGNVHPGAPVLFRDLRVGVVETSQLSSDATAALIRVRLHAPYTGLVRTNSKFWNAGGLPIQISLFGGSRCQSSSLPALVTGAIAFATPDAPAGIAEDGTQFELHVEPEKDWLNWRPTIPERPEETAPEENVAAANLSELIQRETSRPN